MKKTVIIQYQAKNPPLVEFQINASIILAIHYVVSVAINQLAISFVDHVSFSKAYTDLMRKFAKCYSFHLLL